MLITLEPEGVEGVECLIAPVEELRAGRCPPATLRARLPAADDEDTCLPDMAIGLITLEASGIKGFMAAIEELLAGRRPAATPPATMLAPEVAKVDEDACLPDKAKFTRVLLCFRGSTGSDDGCEGRRAKDALRGAMPGEQTPAVLLLPVALRAFFIVSLHVERLTLFSVHHLSISLSRLKAFTWSTIALQLSSAGCSSQPLNVCASSRTCMQKKLNASNFGMNAEVKYTSKQHVRRSRAKSYDAAAAAAVAAAAACADKSTHTQTRSAGSQSQQQHKRPRSPLRRAFRVPLEAPVLLRADSGGRMPFSAAATAAMGAAAVGTPIAMKLSGGGAGCGAAPPRKIVPGGGANLMYCEAVGVSCATEADCCTPPCPTPGGNFGGALAMETMPPWSGTETLPGTTGTCARLPSGAMLAGTGTAGEVEAATKVACGRATMEADGLATMRRSGGSMPLTCST
eukprot:TRINITY_DN71591_c0_g1_i1.p2 TRINITY_DN71591_c0_g1~~TRINITY_DN71591_c0_g1_i1.p2  ORF type:complete len:457 (+),score=65.94 TRINITY_DN71591_c0_g1_i1:1481-2851(+)